MKLTKISSTAKALLGEDLRGDGYKNPKQVDGEESILYHLT